MRMTNLLFFFKLFLGYMKIRKSSTGGVNGSQRKGVFVGVPNTNGFTTRDFAMENVMNWCSTSTSATVTSPPSSIS